MNTSPQQQSPNTSSESEFTTPTTVFRLPALDVTTPIPISAIHKHEFQSPLSPSAAQRLYLKQRRMEGGESKIESSTPSFGSPKHLSIASRQDAFSQSPTTRRTYHLSLLDEATSPRPHPPTGN